MKHQIVGVLLAVALVRPPLPTPVVRPVVRDGVGDALCVLIANLYGTDSPQYALFCLNPAKAPVHPKGGAL